MHVWHTFYCISMKWPCICLLLHTSNPISWPHLFAVHVIKNARAFQKTNPTWVVVTELTGHMLLWFSPSLFTVVSGFQQLSSTYTYSIHKQSKPITSSELSYSYSVFIPYCFKKNHLLQKSRTFLKSIFYDREQVRLIFKKVLSSYSGLWAFAT